MSYIEKHLLPDEHIAYWTNLHWVVFVTPLLFTLAIIFISQLNIQMEVINYGAFIIAISFWASAYLKFLTSEFAITDRRLLKKIGLLRINMVEISFQRIESIEVRQSFPGRLLGYGSVIISGTGGSKDIFALITNPMEFRNKIQEQIDKR